jgi:ABC-type Zn uptake system ZnuABC Zn-binding protein ZnuA
MSRMSCGSLLDLVIIMVLMLFFCDTVDSSSTIEEQEQKSKDVALCIKFIQLVLSTIFGDNQTLLCGYNMQLKLIALAT